VARYRIDPARSRVWIDARSNVHPIHSSTDGLEGYVDLELAADGTIDLTSPVAGTMRLAVIRLTSGKRMEDREMQKRIDARRYPTIQGTLTSVAHAGDDERYRVVGDITFHGTTRSHEDEMTIRRDGERSITLAGRSRFDIRAFGMEPPRVLVLKVEPEVDVRVEVYAVREAS